MCVCGVNVLEHTVDVYTWCTLLNIQTINSSSLTTSLLLHPLQDHLALTHNMNSTLDPAIKGFKRLLEFFSSCTFNLYYSKGKDMFLNNFAIKDWWRKNVTLTRLFQYHFNSLSICTGHYYTFSGYHQKHTDSNQVPD